MDEQKRRSPQAEREHEQLLAKWREHNANWEGIYPAMTYEEWLEMECKHWQRCASAKYREGVYVYSEQDIIDNLQERVNSLLRDNLDAHNMINELHARLEHIQANTQPVTCNECGVALEPEDIETAPDAFGNAGTIKALACPRHGSKYYFV